MLRTITVALVISLLMSSSWAAPPAPTGEFDLPQVVDDLKGGAVSIRHQALDQIQRDLGSDHGLPIVAVFGQAQHLGQATKAAAYLRRLSDGSPTCLIIVNPLWIRRASQQLGWDDFLEFAIRHEAFHCTDFKRKNLTTDPVGAEGALEDSELGADIYAVLSLIKSHRWSQVDRAILLRESMAEEGPDHYTAPQLRQLARATQSADLEQLDERGLIELASRLRDVLVPKASRAEEQSRYCENVRALNQASAAYDQTERYRSQLLAAYDRRDMLPDAERPRLAYLSTEIAEATSELERQRIVLDRLQSETDRFRHLSDDPEFESSIRRVISHFHAEM